MDDLDRLAFRVARTVRTSYPQLFEHGFTLSDIEERLAPFPEARRELAASGQDGYELTLLRLLSGERGYLAGEAGLQEAARRALQTASPTVSLVRTWVGSPLSLRQPAHALGHTMRSGASRVVTGTASGSRATGGTPRPEHGTPASRMRSLRDATQASPDSALDAQAAECVSGCQFCGGTLPSGRSLKFCPYCGLDLTIRYCPACSSELEREWQFCVTCGRQGVASPSAADHLVTAESRAHPLGTSPAASPVDPAHAMAHRPPTSSERPSTRGAGIHP